MKYISSQKTFNHSGRDVQYKTQSAKQDRRHLVVVFSGFCPLGKYNFDGTVADGCRFSILWINDVFDGDNCYYVCSGMDFGVEKAVIGLIEQELERLELSKSECTLFGYSKGGSAALYFGLKYGFQNIVASAPQMHIGSFSKENFPASYKHMIGATDEDSSLSALDDLIPNVLADDVQTNKNIYLVSSLDDQFHETEIVPYLGSFQAYDNFNLIMTDSELVREHKTVGQYNTPIILSILYALGEGSIPKFLVGRTGQREHFSNHVMDSESHSKHQWVVTCDQIKLEKEKLFVEGVALLRGVPQTKYTDKLIALAFISPGKSTEVPLGSVVDRSVSDRFYDNGFCDYSTAGYKTMQGSGVDLSNLEPGTYELALNIRIDDQSTSIPLPYKNIRRFVGFANQFYFNLEASSSKVLLTKRSIIGIDSHIGLEQVDKFEVVKNRLYIEGIFAIAGMDYSVYNNDLFCLVLRSSSNVFRYPLGQGNRPGITGLVDDGFADYSKAYFATLGYAGVDLTGVTPGSYRASISMFVGHTVFTMHLNGYRVQISSEEPSFVQVHEFS